MKNFIIPHNIQNMYNKALAVTSSLFVTPLYALHAQQIAIPPFYWYLITIQGGTSILFWSDPHRTRHSLIHKIDSILARVSIVTIIGYKIWRSPTLLFGANIAAMLGFFYMSDMFSKREWCSRPHLACHGMAHFTAYMAIYLAFMPLNTT